jgi:hemoglobin/transferrin/lactoferrin receptor protein
MHFYTKNAQLSASDSIRLKGSAFTRYATVNNGRTAHADISIGGNKIASMTSATYSDFQNLRSGNIHRSSYKNFGKRFSYQKREDSIDKQVVNPDPNRQRFTQYDRLFLVQKLRYRPDDKVDLGLNLHATSTSSQPNYGQLTEPIGQNEVKLPRRASLIGDSIGWIDVGKEDHPLVFSEWRYGPTTNFQGIATASLTHSWLLSDEADIVGAYHRVNEERITRYFGSPWCTYRKETVDKLTLNIDATKAVKEQYLQYGLETTYNDLSSRAYREHLYNGNREATFTRYPSGGGSMQTYSAYLKFNIDFSDQLRLTQGFRYSKINMSASFGNNKAYFDYTFDEISLNTSAFSGAFNFTYTPVDAWKFSLLGSSGYRVPNLDDAARFSSPDHGTVIVPNPQLKPEYAYNIEASIEGQPIEEINAGLTGYATFLNNAIVRQPYQLNNRDTIEYEGVDSRVLAKVNIGTAFIGGGSLFLDIDLNKHLTFHNRINYAYGRNNEADEPLPHIPPVYGKSALRYGRDKVKVATSFRYNGWKRASAFSPYGTDNLDGATEDGTPAWWTLNVKASYRFNEHLSFQAALENIFDHHYRPFGSEVSAPGRNLVLTLRGSF